MNINKERELIKASKNGNLDKIKHLVEHGADIHADNDYVLRYAAKNGHLEVVKYLAEYGADVHAEDDGALRCAAANGHLEVVKYLAEHGADVPDEELKIKELERQKAALIKHIKEPFDKLSLSEEASKFLNCALDKKISEILKND